MKSTRLLGLVVATALAATALIGAGSASATTLCKVKAISECPAASIYPVGTVLEAHSTNVTIEIKNVKSITCGSSNLSMETESKNGEKVGVPLVGQITKLELGGCANSICYGPNGSLKNLPYKTELEATKNGNGDVAVSSSGKGTPIIELVCFSFPEEETCRYGASPHLTLEANVGNLHLGGVEFKKEAGSGSRCPSAVTVKADFGLKNIPFNAFTATSTIGAGTFQTTCESSLQGNGLSGGMITSVSFSKCGGSCTTAKALNLSYGTSFAATAEGNGTLSVSGPPRIEMNSCALFGFNVTCQYDANNLVLDVGGGGTTLVASKEELTRSGASAFCVKSPTWSAEYSFSTEGPFVIAK